jgi:CRP-like cAMP-binding protein
VNRVQRGNQRNGRRVALGLVSGQEVSQLNCWCKREYTWLVFARPSRRSETDLDIIMSRMKSMVVFERYPEAVLQELSRVVLYDTHLANTTLFRPGENGMYWYVVVSGTLEMFNVDSRDDKKTTLICQLQSGDSFGENVVLEATRETMVVTKTYCELLYVESDNIRRIYEV